MDGRAATTSQLGDRAAAPRLRRQSKSPVTVQQRSSMASASRRGTDRPSSGAPTPTPGRRHRPHRDSPTPFRRGSGYGSPAKGSNPYVTPISGSVPVVGRRAKTYEILPEGSATRGFGGRGGRCGGGCGCGGRCGESASGKQFAPGLLGVPVVNGTNLFEPGIRRIISPQLPVPIGIDVRPHREPHVIYLPEDPDWPRREKYGTSDDASCATQRYYLAQLFRDTRDVDERLEDHACPDSVGRA